MTQRGRFWAAGKTRVGDSRLAWRGRVPWLPVATAAVVLAGLLPVTAVDAGRVVWPGRGPVVVRPPLVWPGPRRIIGWPLYVGPGVAVVGDDPVEYVERSDSALESSGPSDSWYYCRKPEGYYPDVQRCPGGWEKVPPAPGR
jgi:hypothetical protein